MILKRLTALIFLMLISITSVCFAGETLSVRFGNSSDQSSRIIVDLTEKPEYKVMTLQNPSRVVIDLYKSSHRINQIEKMPDNFKTGRLGQNGSTARIVLDTYDIPETKKILLLEPNAGYPWRLVMDVNFNKQVAYNDMADLIEAHPQLAPQEQKKPEQEEKIVLRQPTPGPQPVQQDQKKVIVLDAGHGGQDPGAIGISGVYEKTITLSMAKQIRSILEKTGKYKIKLTRETDVFIPLYNRRKFAQNVKANLFISIHADSTKRPTARGFSIYTLSEKASDKEAEKLAERENKADIVDGIDFGTQPKEVQDILLNLAQRETKNKSAFFAEKVVNELKKTPVISLLSQDIHRFAGFAVLKAPDVPSVLMEMGFLSNKYEEKNLRSNSYREKMAQAIVKAIEEYFPEEHKATFN